MPGEGIGPEMMRHVRDIFKVAGAPVDFEVVHLDPTTDNYDDLYNVGTFLHWKSPIWSIVKGWTTVSNQ